MPSTDLSGYNARLLSQCLLSLHEIPLSVQFIDKSRSSQKLIVQASPFLAKLSEATAYVLRTIKLDRSYSIS